jgi:hypothetical protein
MFRIAEADQKDRIEDSDVRKRGKERGKNDGEGHSGTGHAENRDAEIVSPAVYVTTFSTEAINLSQVT